MVFFVVLAIWRTARYCHYNYNIKCPPTGGKTNWSPRTTCVSIHKLCLFFLNGTSRNKGTGALGGIELMASGSKSTTYILQLNSYRSHKKCRTGSKYLQRSRYYNILRSRSEIVWGAPQWYRSSLRPKKKGNLKVDYAVNTSSGVEPTKSSKAGHIVPDKLQARQPIHLYIIMWYETHVRW